MSYRPFSLLLAAGLGLATPVLAGERAILVLDASGSMWAEVGGRTKVEIARDAVDALLQNWRPDQALGLIAYGHRRKGDCADIELLRPAEDFQPQALRQQVRALNARGMTPISAAVRQAAEQLKYTEQAATVILVSDGEETCEADPCALGQELERLGVNFTAHVVGFDLPEGPARQQLQCLATATGGRYLEARNAGELTAALGEVAAAPAPELETAQFWIPGQALEWDAGESIDPEADSGGTRVIEYGVDQTAEDCQRACADDTACGGWHYEPTGSFFIDYPRCHLKGQWFPMRLREEGEGWVAGVKPGVRLIRSDQPTE
jgi:hypothetical protein